MNTKSYFVYSLILSLCLALTACGFHLRGNEKLPAAIKVIYIQSSTPYGNFEQTLRESLLTYNIKIVDSPKDANVILNIASAGLSQAAGAVSATLTLRQYTLNYNVTYQILSPKGKAILPANTVSSTTSFTSSMSDMMLSSKNATAQYLPPLQRDAVFRIISQLLSNQSQQALNKYMQSHS
jgi:LPS-assembly lipoprotein